MSGHYEITQYFKTVKGGRFTLIEMLVVIAIISILASMLAPSINKSLELAEKINCQNNLKNYGVALQYYAGDYNNYKPAGYVLTTDGYPENVWWEEFLYPYMNVKMPVHYDRKIWPYACPDSAAREYVNSTNLFSYNCSYYVIPTRMFVKYDKTSLGNTISSLGKCASFMDGTGADGKIGPHSSVTTGWQALAYRHAAQCCAVYLDGHTEGFADPYFDIIGDGFWLKSSPNYDADWAKFWGME